MGNAFGGTRRVRALAFISLVMVAVAACGGSADPASEQASSTTVGDVATSTAAPTTVSETVAPTTTSAPSGDGESSALCDALVPDDLAVSTGSEVVDSRSYEGHVDHETLLMNLRGCAVELADGNRVLLTRVYERPDDILLTSEGFETFRAEEAEYERGPVDDSYPYAEVSELGVPAFFAGSNTSHDLFMNVDDEVLYLTGAEGSTLMDRDVLAAIAADALDALNGSTGE